MRRPAVACVLPAAGWLPRYERRSLRGDIAAGIAVTALIVQKDLGYAGIAGVPLQNGLYAAAAGAIIYALFCTSRQISTGPSSSLAAVAGGAVVAVGIAGDQAAELVAAGIFAAYALDLGDHGVALVGDVPSGLPAPELPDFETVREHIATILVAASALVLIGFSRTAGDARAFAARHRYRIDVDQESVAQGMANAGAGAFQGMPVSWEPTTSTATSIHRAVEAELHP